MSSRKRPLREISQPHSTPSRYEPSTPHAIRALQQRSGAKTRSARTLRQASADAVRPDSIRGVLRQFAKIAAPITKKRIATPSSVYVDKENQRPDNGHDDDNDSILSKRPNLTFAIEESNDEDDSELLAVPTPSALPDDEDDEQPTITFQHAVYISSRNPASDRRDGRRSRKSLIHSEPLQAEDQEEQEADYTMMTERGRRALSEDATSRLSRYSFGSIRMSDFGTELEIRRESNKQAKPALLELDNYALFGGDDSLNGDETEHLRRLPRSPSTEIADDSIHLSVVGDETFRLEVPQDEEEASVQEAHTNLSRDGDVALASLESEAQRHSFEQTSADNRGEDTQETSKRHTLLETATTQSHTTRLKRVKLTRHGTTVPSLPTSLIKRVVLNSYEKQSKRQPKLGRDHMKALEQATEWFFEQAAEDLAAYSSHGRRRKRIDTGDVLLLMRRQKVLAEEGELRNLAKSWLPKDILNGLDLPDIV